MTDAKISIRGKEHEPMYKGTNPRQEQARQARLDQFPGKGTPPADLLCEVLCEDHVGAYMLPFACQWVTDQWRNAETGEALAGVVVGWRPAPGRTLTPV